MQLAILHCDLAITLLARVGHVQEGLDMYECSWWGMLRNHPALLHCLHVLSSYNA